jgi:hypothetical protein
MASSHQTKVVRRIGLLAFFITALLLQNGPPVSNAEKDKDVLKQEQSEGKHDGKPDHDKKPCVEDDPKGGGQGYCYKHIKGAWAGDSQNFPSCTGGYVCNSPGAPCSDAAVTNGHCTLSPNTGNCNCKCL